MFIYAFLADNYLFLPQTCLSTGRSAILLAANTRRPGSLTGQFTRGNCSTRLQYGHERSLGVDPPTSRPASSLCANEEENQITDAVAHETNGNSVHHSRHTSFTHGVRMLRVARERVRNVEVWAGRRRVRHTSLYTDRRDLRRTVSGCTCKDQLVRFMFVGITPKFTRMTYTEHSKLSSKAS